MEAKRNDISTLLREMFIKTTISKQLNVRRVKDHWVEQRLKASEYLKDRSRSGRPQVIRQKAVKEAFKHDPCQKMTRLAQEKKISVYTVSRRVKKMSVKTVRCFRKPLLSAAGVQKRLEKSTHLLNDLKSHGNRILIFSHKKSFTVDPVFNK